MRIGGTRWFAMSGRELTVLAVMCGLILAAVGLGRVARLVWGRGGVDAIENSDVVAPPARRPACCVLSKPKMLRDYRHDRLQRRPPANVLQLGNTLVRRPVVEQTADAGNERVRSEEHPFQGLGKR